MSIPLSVLPAPLSPPALRRRALAAVSCLAVLLAGCNPSTGGEEQFACSGQEQVNSLFVGDDAATAIQKTHPARLDINLRSQKIFVKGYAATYSESGPVLSFAIKGAAAWLNGQLDRRAGTLTLIEERTLSIAGRTQQVRTSGQYVCK